MPCEPLRNEAECGLDPLSNHMAQITNVSGVLALAVFLPRRRQLQRLYLMEYVFRVIIGVPSVCVEGRSFG